METVKEAPGKPEDQMKGGRRTRAFDLLPPLQGRLLVVDGLAGQREDPDLCHFAHHVLLVAAQRQDQASLRRVLHDLPGSQEVKALGLS